MEWRDVFSTLTHKIRERSLEHDRIIFIRRKSLYCFGKLCLTENAHASESSTSVIINKRAFNLPKSNNVDKTQREAMISQCEPLSWQSTQYKAGFSKERTASTSSFGRKIKRKCLIIKIDLSSEWLHLNTYLNFPVLNFVLAINSCFSSDTLILSFIDYFIVTTKWSVLSPVYRKLVNEVQHVWQIS